MNNNTQIETVEEAAARFNPIIKRSSPFGNKYDWIPNRERKQFINGANWQKEQDEAYTQHLETTIKLWESKCKELLDSHNELLIAIENPTAYNLANPYRLSELINKAKNIKQQ